MQLLPAIHSHVEACYVCFPFSAGIVACVRLATSANKNPFGAGEFGRQIAKVASEWLSMNTFAAEMNCPGLWAQELHSCLESGIGKWNQEEVKLARFFDWPSKFRHYVKFWTFLEVREQWKNTYENELIGRMKA